MDNKEAEEADSHPKSSGKKTAHRVEITTESRLQ
jgi:hypothetical protein